MRKSIQVRWIEQAEMRSFREHATLKRAASEPHVGIGDPFRCSTELSDERFFDSPELTEVLRRLAACGAVEGGVINGEFSIGESAEEALDVGIAHPNRGARYLARC